MRPTGLLIGWARSRSMSDFGGRYRVWRWLAAVLFVLSAGVLTRTDRALTATLDWAGFERPWPLPSLDWMVPLGALALPLLWLSDREVRVSRVARVHLWQAAVLLGSGLALPLVDRIDLPQEPLLAHGLILAGLLSLGMSLLWFTRHVLYLSSEPAQIRKRDLLKWVRPAFGWLGRLRLPKLRRQIASEETSEEQSADEPAPKPKSKRRRGAKKAATKKPAAKKSAPPQEKPDPVPEPEPAFVSKDDLENARNDAELPDDPELAERVETDADDDRGRGTDRPRSVQRAQQAPKTHSPKTPAPGCSPNSTLTRPDNSAALASPELTIYNGVLTILRLIGSRVMNAPTPDQAGGPPQQSSSGRKVMLVLLGVVCVTVLLCCGGGLFIYSKIDTKVYETPADILAVRNEIMQIDVPQRYKPIGGADIDLFIYRSKMAMYRQAEGVSQIAILSVDVTFGKSDLEDARKQMKQQGGAADRAGRNHDRKPDLRSRG